MSQFVLTEFVNNKLISFSYKEAWANFWNKITPERKQQFLDLPNFDPEIFKEITGIDVKTNNLVQKAEELEKEAEILLKKAQELRKSL